MLLAWKDLTVFRIHSKCGSEKLMIAKADTMIYCHIVQLYFAEQ